MASTGGTNTPQSLPAEWATCVVFLFVFVFFFSPSFVCSESVWLELQSQHLCGSAGRSRQRGLVDVDVAASNDSRDHSCEHLTFPLRGAAQVGRPDRTTLFRGRWDLALLPQDYDLAARQDLLAFTPSCRYMKPRYFWTMIKWPRRGFW